MVNVERAIISKFPTFKKYPKAFKNPCVYGARKLMFQNEINTFLKEHESTEGFDFIEAVLEYFNFTYSISNKHKLNIPASGRVVIIANHPLGALDALSLLMLVKEVREDVKVVANDVLSQIPQLHSLMIPVDNLTSSSTKEQIKKVYAALSNDEAVIIFPAGEVSRAKMTGIKDTKWQKGFLRFAKKTNSPILPVYIQGKNSPFFYTASSLNKKLSTLLLVREMFKQRSKEVNFKIGELIPYASIYRLGLPMKVQVELLKKHLYKISRGKKGLFATQTSIAHPENRQTIKKELKDATLLGETVDKKKIFLYEHKEGSSVMKEIGRLREYTFRKVEEGTGTKRDTDAYDKYYQHIILWDDDALEIVGSYRIANSNAIYQKYGYKGFYSHTLFRFQESMEPFLQNSIELGRSFVQPRYWGSRALDYLWQGIGAYLAKNPNIQYMFGPVSLSDMYPKLAKNLILEFYSTYFPAKQSLVCPRDAFFMSRLEQQEAMEAFSGDDYMQDFKILKEQLSHMGLNIPTLYKQYADLCQSDGIWFVAFNVDKDFADCVDSFIMVDVTKIKDNKRKRYIK